jgi:uncharacterized protein with von Willebrand factor type A (vWA) domain
VLAQLGVPKTYDALEAIGRQLREAFGDDRGSKLLAALRSELDASAARVRQHVVTRAAERQTRSQTTRSGVRGAAFTSLTDAEMAEVRRAVRLFAERLRGGEQVRRRRSRRGRFDAHRTLRRALRTGGVPFTPLRKERRRNRPRLILLCDVSDSVRTAARFMMEFAYAAQELFERTRTFVFVSELGETTRAFADESASVALGHAYSGGVVSIVDNSNYGRVLRDFAERFLRDLDRRTTVVILGDGRTNYHDDGAEVLDRIRARARALVWLCPEERGQWATGDSAMNRYAPKCTRVLEVRCALDLERAARTLLAFRK